MLSAAYANYGVSQAQSQAFPLVVQNDGAALELAHHDYQSQLAGHINAYNLATAAVPGDQLPSFHQHPSSATSMALQQYTDATGYQFQPPNPQASSSVTENILAPHIPATLPSHPQPTRSTLHFSNLEPWMDVEYFNKLAGMMNWQNVILKIPTTPSNEGVGSFGKSGSLVPNNPGYCFITFPTPASAAAVLKSLTEGDHPKVMPNSKRPFVVTWATVPASSARTNAQRADSFGVDPGASGLFAPGNLSLLNLYTPPAADDPASQPNRQQEFSIFVGDLAPETTNSDLIAVFRDPILGLRHDREPKFVAPFLSCKSAKIMVDPVMGVSKGYGFVRFGTPTDASRALIEMQGLYCLSRPSGFDSTSFTVASTLTRHVWKCAFLKLLRKPGLMDTLPKQPPLLPVTERLPLIRSPHPLITTSIAMGPIAAQDPPSLRPLLPTLSTPPPMLLSSVTRRKLLHRLDPLLRLIVSKKPSELLPVEAK